MIPCHFLDGLVEVFAQQTHNGPHFLLGSLPIFRGKGVDGQVIQADVFAVGGDGAEGLRTGGVSGRSGHPPFLGPAAVAIHDDGNVTGQAVKIHLGMSGGSWFLFVFTK